MTQKELNKVLEKHQHWLRKDCRGWDNMRAVLDNENLDGLDFRGAMLDKAFLDYASLNGAYLYGASLNHASFYKASLNGAYLDGASLNGTSFVRASLIGASLNNTSLDNTCFNNARLDGASFARASLNDTSFCGVSLNNVTNFPFIPFACPDTGSFIGWKKAHGKIIKLEIPADAKRCSATSNKCRCNKAKVLEIQEIDGSVSDVTEISSDYDYKFIYEVGKTVSVADFCEDRWEECSQGIHFFINRQSAVEY